MPDPREADPIEQTLLPVNQSVSPSGAAGETPAHPAANEETVKPQPPVIANPSSVVLTSVTEAEVTRAPVSSIHGSGTSQVDVTQVPTSARSSVPDKTIGTNGRSVPAPTSTTATDTQVGRFALRGLHARGGLGEVFTARDTELNREVAVKRIQSRYADDAASRRRFLSEAEITARLDHPGVVPVFGLVADGFGRPCYAMRFIRGETLKDEIERYHGTEKSSKNAEPEAKDARPAEPKTEIHGQPRSVAFRQLLQRFIAVCQAIAYAHTRKVIHRDIKPANVMVGSFGETLVVDWGLAKALDDGPALENLLKDASTNGLRHDPDATELPSHLTMAGTAVGTPAYMSPEQASGQLDLIGPAADVYSLGATLFAILTGKAPFAGNATETLDKVRRGEYPSPVSVNPEVSPPLDVVCRKAMSLRPASRYATPLELAADIERWLSDEPVSCYRYPLAARLARWARQHPARVATAVSLLLAGVFAAIGIIWAVSSEQKKTQRALDLVTEAEAKAARERDRVIVEQGRTKLALDDVTRHKVETEKQRVAAVDARDVARERYGAAVKAFNTLVVNIQQTLADRAGTQDLRRELLVEAQAGLQKLIDKGGAEKIGGDRTLVAAHRQMGDVYQLLGNTREALKELQQAVQLAINVLIDAQTRKSNIEEKDARQDLGISSIRLAEIQLQAGNTAAAKRACETALEMLRKVLEHDANDCGALENLALAQNQFGDVLIERGETTAAEKQCREALDVRRKIAAEVKTDLAAQRRLADSLDQYAEILHRAGRSSAAGEIAREGLAVLVQVNEKLSPQPNLNAQRELAEAHSRLGEILLDRGDLSGSRKEFEEARDLLVKLRVVDPRSAGAKAALAVCHGWLAAVALRVGELANALKEATTSNQLCKEVDADDPDSTRTTRDLAASYERLGDVLLAQGRSATALAAYLDSEKLLAPIERKDPDSVLAKLALAHARERSGEGQLATGNAAAAVVSLNESVALREKVWAVDPGSARAIRELALGLGWLADAYRAARQRVLARDTVAREVTLLRQLVDSDAKNSPARRDLAMAMGKWGEVLAEDGKPTVALIAFVQSLDQLQTLASADKSDARAQADLAAGWEKLAEMRSRLGQSETARSAAHNALTIRKELAQAAGDTKASRRELAVATIRFADTYISTGQFGLARKWYESARQLVPLDPADAQTVAIAQLANDKLAMLDAIDAVMKDPGHGLDGIPVPLRIPALKTATDTLLKGNKTVAAAAIAWQLATTAITPEDRYKAAQSLALCTQANNITASVREGCADDAVKALELAVAAGFRDVESLKDPEWDICRRLPEFQKVLKSMSEGKQMESNPGSTRK